MIDQLQDTILEAHQKTRLKEDEITLLHRRNLMFREELSEQEKQLIEYKSQNHQMSSVLKGLQVEKNVALDSIHEEMASLKHEVESLTVSSGEKNDLMGYCTNQNFYWTVVDIFDKRQSLSSET